MVYSSANDTLLSFLTSRRLGSYFLHPDRATYIERSVEFLVGIIVTASVSCICFSCSHTTEPHGNPPFLQALAGEDRTSFVGGFVILEGSFMCSPALDTLTYSWTQEETNPETLPFFSSDRTQTLGFKKEGTYRYVLRVSSGATQSEPDTVTIQVGPNRQHLFVDPKLEITIRVHINKPQGDLTLADLAGVDSLGAHWYARQITSLEGITSCPNLRVLGLSRQAISDLRPLGTLTRLEVLDIDQNYRIRDLSPLSALTSLVHLNCDTDSISDLSALSSLKELRYFNVNLTQVSDISVVANFPNLERLYLANLTKVTDISALKHLVKLQRFFALGCQISDIGALADHPDLDYLELDFNRVSDLSPLAASTKLVRLYLVDNQVQDITVLKNMPELNLVALPDNRVTNILPLVENPGLGQGDLVDIQRNPLDTISVKQYIPTLQLRGVTVLH